MSNILSHAKRELALLGYIPLDQEQEDGPNKWIQENLFELLEVFAKQGHSGFSAPYTLNLFHRLAMFEPILPLTGDDSEWEKIDFQTWQNKRCSHVFKDAEGTCTNSQGIIFEDSDGCRYTSKGSSVVITFPYIPKTEVVKIPKQETPE